MKTLYLCYFGLREPLVQSQVLPYLRELSKCGINVSLLTFEPNLQQAWSSEELDDARARLQAEGIRWFSLPYHKRPSVPTTLYDIFAGAKLATKLVRRDCIDVLHARAHIPLAMALLAKRWVKCRVIFDIRGLMAEEYADAGVWTEHSLPFRAVKRLERAGIHQADQIIVLTRRMRDWLIEQQLKSAEQIEVVPCCVDFSRFDEIASPEARAVAPRFEVVYAGSATGLYLLEEMGRFFLEFRARQPDAFLRILTHSDAASVAAVLERAGLSRDDFWIGAVSPSEVSTHLQRAQLGLSFRKPTFSQIAASPTKIPEYLAAGLPVVCNSGVGDTDDLLTNEQVGVVFRNFDRQSYADAAERALTIVHDSHLSARAKAVARRHFDLELIGGARYCSVYRRIEKQSNLVSSPKVSL